MGIALKEYTPELIWIKILSSLWLNENRRKGAATEIKILRYFRDNNIELTLYLRKLGISQWKNKEKSLF